MFKIICLKGGVGNQLFEYCRFCQLQAAGHNVYLHYDRRRLKQHNGQRIDQIFRITLPTEPWWVIMLVVMIKVLRKLHLAPRLYDDARPDCTLIDDYCQNRQSTLNAHEVLHFREDILTQEACAVADKMSGMKHAVAIHVRRGDYLHVANVNNFGTCSLTYYEIAMKKVREKHPEAQFFLFSDDVPWCKSQTAFLDCHIVELRKSPDYVSLYLMTLCKSHIIANSTFSFWGAFLGMHKDGLNIYPRQWFANAAWNKPDFLPADWIAMP